VVVYCLSVVGSIHLSLCLPAGDGDGDGDEVEVEVEVVMFIVAGVAG
jgi:hypothetical protein